VYRSIEDREREREKGGEVEEEKREKPETERIGGRRGSSKRGHGGFILK